jgi:hypothetical protein
MSREFVDAIVDGNNMEAENVFTKSVAAKVGSTLEVKRKELANTFVKSMSVSKEEKDESEV